MHSTVTAALAGLLVIAAHRTWRWVTTGPPYDSVL